MFRLSSSTEGDSQRNTHNIEPEICKTQNGFFGGNRDQGRNLKSQKKN